MAIDTDTRNAPTWDAALKNYEAAKAAVTALENHDSGPFEDEVLARYDCATDLVFEIAGPTLGAIARKLEIFWGERLFRQNVYGNEFRQRVVGDLRRIERMNAGVPEPDATGGLDVAEAADRWSEASQALSISADLDQDVETLLGLPALNVDHVIEKLELLWSDGGIDPVDDDQVTSCILRDLRRFASSDREATQ